nr:MAG TPA: hypothetical protein [Caudoviricetes sp.]
MDQLRALPWYLILPFRNTRLSLSALLFQTTIHHDFIYLR